MRRFWRVTPAMRRRGSFYGAPFDSTTSYRPGTRFGSRAIRSESYGLESYSPYQDRDLTDYAVFDAGDQELCFGDASLALKDLRERAAEVAGDGKIPFMLGGEHLVTLAPVQALAEKYPDLHIIHFDAHADLRDDYLRAKLSHACAATLLGSPGRRQDHAVWYPLRRPGGMALGKRTRDDASIYCGYGSPSGNSSETGRKTGVFYPGFGCAGSECFREQERRNRAESVLRNFDGQSPGSAAQLGLLDVM